MNTLTTLKLALVAGAISFFSSEAVAQGAYVKLGLGYNFGMGSEIDYHTSRNSVYTGTGAPVEVTDYEMVNISYGKGIVAGGTLEYMFTNNIGAELGIGYLTGSKSKVKHSETAVNTSFSQNSVFTSELEISTRSSMVLFQPAVVISAGLTGANPYARFGLIVAKGSIKNESNFTTSNGQKLEAADKYIGSAGIGMQAALGLDYKINDKLGIYSEVAFNNLSYSPTKGEVTKYVQNGDDRLPNMKPAQKELVFEDTYSYNPAVNPSINEPSSAPKQRLSLNSIGLNIGIKLSF